jgi:hypothetical protein
MRWAAFLLLFWLVLASDLLGQQRGSIEAFRAEQNAMKRELADQDNFRESTKITVLKPVPTSARDGSTRISDLVPDAECYIEDWHLQVLSIVDADEMLLADATGAIVWLEGYATKDFVDDQKVRILGPIKVSGTKAYTDVEGGVVKVRTIRLLTVDEIATIAKKEAEEAEAKQYRKFTDASGKHSFEGKFIEYKNSMVVLLRKDTQKTIEVKMTQLSKEDGEWIRAEMKARKEKAETERKTKSKKL